MEHCESHVSVEQLVAAVGTLYGSDPVSANDANAWLQQVAASPQAWELCLRVLAAPAHGQETLYFAANVLLSKVRREWGDLPQDTRTHLTQAMSGQLQGVAELPLVAERLCLALGAAAAASGPDVAREFAQSSLGLGATNAPLALGLLAAFGDEANDAQWNRREQLVAAVAPSLPGVLSLCQAVAGTPDALVRAMKCVDSWVKLAPGGLERAVSPGVLVASHQQLFGAILNGIAADDDQVGERAADLIVELLTPGTSGAPEAEGHAARAIVTTIVSLRARALEEHEMELARNICRVAAALCERHAEYVARGEDDTIALIQLVLELAGKHERPVMEAATEVLLMVNTIPLPQRHPFMSGQLFMNAISVCLHHATLPPTFTSWEEAGGDVGDADSFNRFREQVLLDVLDTAYGLLKFEFIRIAGQQLQTATTWQQAEAAVFLVRSVGVSVKSHVLSKRASDTADAALKQDRDETNAFLDVLFKRLAEEGEGGLFSSHPLVVDSSARLVAQYAAWFGSRAGAPVQGTLTYLLRAMRVPAAWSQAANAFRNLCSRCSRQLRDPTLLASLMDSVEQCMPPPPPMPMPDEEPLPDERVAIIEGLARVVASLPPAEASSAGLKLTAPLLQRAQQSVQLPAGVTVAPPAQAYSLACELRLLAAAVRFMEFSDSAGSPTHPAMAILQAAWPVLGHVGDSQCWRAQADVVDALCEVYARSLLCAKEAAAPLLPPMMTTLVGTFEGFHHPYPLDCLAVTVEVFGRVDTAAEDPNGVAGALDQALRSVCGSVSVLLQRAVCSERPELMRALFELAHRYALFAPGQLLPNPALPSLFGLAVQVAGTMNGRDPVRAALNFLGALLNPGQRALCTPAWAAGRGAVDACLSTQGATLVQGLLFSAASNCPRHLLKLVGTVLYAVQVMQPQAFSGWLTSVVADAEYPAKAGAGNAVLQETDKRKFFEAALRQPPLPLHRFESLIADFGTVCRREAAPDILVAYSA